MGIEFPKIKPSSLTFTPATYSVTVPKFREIVVSPRLDSSKPNDPTLALSFRHINADKILSIFDAWENSRSGFFGLILPTEITSSIKSVDFQNRIVTPESISWRFSSEPVLSNFTAGVGDVSVQLIGDFGLPNTLILAGTVTGVVELNGVEIYYTVYWVSGSPPILNSLTGVISNYSGYTAVLLRENLGLASGGVNLNAPGYFYNNSNTPINYTATHPTNGYANGVRVAPAFWMRSPRVRILRTGDNLNTAESTHWVTSATTFTPGARNGGGNEQQSTEALLSFTPQQTTMTWDTDNQAYGFTFTLSEEKTIKGVGLYDLGANGLNGTYGILLLQNSTDLTGSIPDAIPFDEDGNLYVVTIPSGTVASLSGPWRRVDLEVAGAVLGAGNYTLVCATESQNNVDNLALAAGPLTMASGVTYGLVYYWDTDANAGSYGPFGTPAFGPMLFFE